jgi:hypothetical protein
MGKCRAVLEARAQAVQPITRESSAFSAEPRPIEPIVNGGYETAGEEQGDSPARQWFRVFVHSDIDVPVVLAGESCLVAHDEQCRTMLSPAISTCGLPSFQGGNEPFRELPIPAVAGFGRRPRHGFEDLLAASRFPCTQKFNPEW